MCRELKEIIPDLYMSTHPAYLIGRRLKTEPVNYVYTRYHVINDDAHATTIAGWDELRCPGLVIISHAWVGHDFQGLGMGKYLAKLRCDAFEVMKEGYEHDFPCEQINMICRVNPHNQRQIHIMESLGWIRLNEVIWTRP